MKADYLTYRRAASTAWQGLVLQVLLTAALAIYGALARDHAATSGVVFVAAGIFVWLALGIVFDQQRRERIEAMEAETLAQSPEAGTSVFDSQAQEFRPAARRLANLLKFFWPAMSILMALSLVIFGILRAGQGHDRLTPEGFSKPLFSEWSMGLGIGIAVVGFLFARYTAGMAKQTAWANLRAGAAASVGTALIGLAIAVAHFINYVASDAVVRYSQVAIPAFVVLIGFEIFVQLLFTAYRPRKPGEIVRPAFDSRLLGLVAAPDRIAQSISDAINYQMGFNVTSGWLYQLLARLLGVLALVAVLVIWTLTWVTVLGPDDVGLRLRFGRVVEANMQPGLHFKRGWPIDSVYVPELIERDARGRVVVKDRNATAMRTLQLGTGYPANNEPILWTNDHAGEEVWQYVRASGSSNPSGDGTLADIAAISVEMPMQYYIGDVLLFDQLAPPEQRDLLLKTIAQRAVTLYFQEKTVDEVLGGDRVKMSEELRARVQAAFDRLNPGPDGKPRGTGVKLLYVGISGVHPPKDTASAFETPIMADQRREANIDTAKADSIKTLATAVGNVDLAETVIREIATFEELTRTKAPREKLQAQEEKIEKLIEAAGGNASKTLAAARADRWQQHMTARGLAERYDGQLALYNASPDFFRTRNYFSALATVVNKSRVYVTANDRLRVDVNLEDRETSQNVFRGEEDK